MATAEDTLVRFVVGFDASQIPADVRAVAREACLDCLGVMLAGSRQAPAVKVHEQLRRHGSGHAASVVGTALRASPMDAALANGTAAHALDYDDMGAFGHPSAVLLPAVLAVGESLDASGEQLLAAYAVGFEVGAALNKGLGISRGESGLHTTGMIGVFAATAAVSRLLGLTEEQVKHAMGVAASTPAGLVQNFGTHTKSLHAGMAARNAVMAATLAADGFTSNPAFLEGAGAMLAVYGKADTARLRANLEGLGTVWQMSVALTLKRFPCCGSTHAAINAVRAMFEAAPVPLDDIEQIEVGELPPASHVLLYPDPATGLQGKFSIEFATARALCDHGDITVESFADDAVSEPAYRDLLSKVRVAVGSKWNHGTEATFEDTTVTLRLKDGSVLSESVNRYAMPGTRKAPLDTAAIREKFEANCRRAGLESDALYERWSDIGAIGSVRDALAATAPVAV
ncbi:MAG: hypothetical protein GEU80_06105 [Dehalococcoidia bacterium]|nr:hypothetical protein [Dehalococcoidia bacterium]